MRNVLQEFCQTATVHGLSIIVPFSFKAVKLVWFTIVLAGFIGLSLHLYNISVAFLKRHSTVYFYKLNDSYHFPNVTICNGNGISSSRFLEAAKSRPQIKCIFEETNNDNMTELCKMLPKSFGDTDLFWTLGNDTHKVGHSLEDLVLTCNFEFKNCTKDDFIRYPYPKFFNCYTFKGGKDHLTKSQASIYGLSLTLYLEPLDPTLSVKYVSFSVSQLSDALFFVKFW